MTSRAAGVIAPLVILGGSASALCAQTALFSNGSADPTLPALSTGAASASGVPAPAGAWWSELQADAGGANAIAGFSVHRLLGTSGSYRVADNFTVSPETWTIDRLDVFVYQTGFDGPASPLAGATARIWWGVPDAPQSVLLWGDTTTNRLIEVEATNVYRVFNSMAAPSPEAPTPSRRIWRASLNLGGLQLTPGAYWVDWQFESDNPDQEVFAVPSTTAGARETQPPSALHLDWRDAGAWRPAVDPGKPVFAPDAPQDFAFMLVGDPGAPVCRVDWDLNGVVNSTDVAAFINSWFEDQVNGTLTADFDGNGASNSTDVSEFINVWFASQPYCT